MRLREIIPEVLEIWKAFTDNRLKQAPDFEYTASEKCKNLPDLIISLALQCLPGRKEKDTLIHFSIFFFSKLRIDREGFQLTVHGVNSPSDITDEAADYHTNTVAVLMEMILSNRQK